RPHLGRDELRRNPRRARYADPPDPPPVFLGLADPHVERERARWRTVDAKLDFVSGRLRLPAALDAQLDRLSGALANQLRPLLERRDGLAVDRQDPVAGLEPGLLRRAPGAHVADDGRHGQGRTG